ncbi:hypothetical protein OJAV_G00105090 [Oryzias javanicus]|uniref:S100P-binding protein n=1 Tax=Oryzias javanicus TaxID=123683 RepID=A0A3S2MI58_ORYJA|nr:hypothetical protein OJAV_G00105090 [Oryzias javanicus]
MKKKLNRPPGRDSLSTFTLSRRRLNKKRQAPVRDLRDVICARVRNKIVDLRYKLDAKRQRRNSSWKDMPPRKVKVKSKVVVPKKTSFEARDHSTSSDSPWEDTPPLKVKVKSKVVVPKKTSFEARDYSTSRDSPWEDTPPLKVKVKSKVVVQKKTSFEPKDYSRPQKRPTVHLSQSELKRRCRKYLNAVISEMNEDQESVQAMTELQDLMSSVSGQSRSHSASRQHPLDLTRRNYQQRSNEEMPLVSLNEWQRMNGLNYNRFATVPKIFQRNSTRH